MSGREAAFKLFSESEEILNWKNFQGFSVIELMIVLSVIGILASIAIPINLQHKDNAIVGVTMANIQAMRTGLTQHTISDASNKYPTAEMNYHDFRLAIPEANLPPLPTDAKIVSGSFSYSSDGDTYTLKATSTNRTGEKFTAIPAMISNY